LGCLAQIVSFVVLGFQIVFGLGVMTQLIHLFVLDRHSAMAISNAMSALRFVAATTHHKNQPPYHLFLVSE